MAVAQKKRPSAKIGKYFLILGLSLFAVIAIWHFGSYGLYGQTSANIISEDNGIIVHFIDVGQGDAALIQTNEGSVLIDGGGRRAAQSVVQYLRDSGVDRITCMIATHPHGDHIAGLVNVLDAFEVDTVIMPRAAHTTNAFERLLDAIERSNVNLKEPVAGSFFTLGKTVFTIIAPNSTGYINLNDYSVSVRVLHGNVAFLFTGDAEAESENEMLERRHNISVRVLKVGHHGSRTSTTKAFLDALSPEIAVISCGLDNSFGHPHEEVVKRLEDAGITIFRTDLHGTIVMSTDGVSLTVTSER